MPDKSMPTDTEPSYLVLITIEGQSHALVVPSGWTMVALPTDKADVSRALKRLGLEDDLDTKELLGRLAKGEHFPKTLTARIEMSAKKFKGVVGEGGRKR